MNDMVTVRNLLNGGVAVVKRSFAVHEKFGKNLEIVPDGSKPKVSLSKLVDKRKDKTVKVEAVEPTDLPEDKGAEA